MSKPQPQPQPQPLTKAQTGRAPHRATAAAAKLVTLINWTARRAGGRITIMGVDAETHQPVKIVGIETITGAQERLGLATEGERLGTLAVRFDGTVYELR